jgi:hypothetical protein
MAFGPIQLLVVGVDRPGSQRELVAEFQRLRVSDAVRLLDVLVVHKDAHGVIERAESSDVALGEADGGVLVETLVGLGPAGRPAPDAGATDGGPGPAEDEFWSLDEAIPNDSDAVLVLIEHRWAIATRDAIRAAGGTAVADAWIHPADLLAAGLSDPEAGAFTP